MSVRSNSSAPAIAIAIAMKRIVKTFPGVKALNDVSFDRRPEVHALVGENGAGKSTLIRSSAAFSRPTAVRSSSTARPSRSGIWSRRRREESRSIPRSSTCCRTERSRRTSGLAASRPPAAVRDNILLALRSMRFRFASKDFRGAVGKGVCRPIWSASSICARRLWKPRSCSSPAATSRNSGGGLAYGPGTLRRRRVRRRDWNARNQSPGVREQPACRVGRGRPDDVRGRPAARRQRGGRSFSPSSAAHATFCGRARSLWATRTHCGCASTARKPPWNGLRRSRTHCS